MKKIYAIRDRIAQELVGMRMYLLMIFRTDQEAVRYFADAINDTSSILNKHPSDYELVKLGHLTPEDTLHADEKGTTIITGDALIAAQQPALVKDA